MRTAIAVVPLVLVAVPAAAQERVVITPVAVIDVTDGSVHAEQAGRLADLVLLDANPLDDITNTQRIRAVIADGRLYRRAELDDILAGAERAAAGGE